MADLWRILNYLRPYWRSSLGALLSLLIVTATNLINPQILQIVVDKGILVKDLSVITWAAVGLLGVAALRDFFTFAQNYLTERASQSSAYEIRNAIFARIENLSFSYHDKAQTGQLMTRVTSDVEAVRNFTGSTLLQIVNAVIMLIGSATILLLTNWQLALVALAIVPAVIVVFIFFLRAISPLFRLVQQKLGNLNTILQENLAGVRVIKALDREPYELSRYQKANDELLQDNLKVVRGTSLAFPTIFLISNLGTLAVIWFGGSQVIGNTLQLGQLVAFNSYLSFLLQPVFILGSSISQISQSSASAKRVFEVIDAPLDVADKPDAIELPKLSGQVAFETVSFKYAGSENPVLTDISFVARPGQTVAILGRTGSGKSSLINLIPRFYDVTSGRVLADSHDVRDVKLASLRSQIGVVLQETTLFSGTIRDNIAYGKPNTAQAEVEAAARSAQAHQFISTFPDGYNTIVGERGVNLSGGQKQRLAIARALLLNPAILILDDSTSAVDAETEYQLQQALASLMKNRTTFIIAQRISTVRNADLILLLDDGHLVAQGTHQQLIISSPLYCEIVESQLYNDQSSHEDHKEPQPTAA